MHKNYLIIITFLLFSISASLAQTDPDISRKEVEEKAMRTNLVQDLPDSLENWKTGATLNSNVTNTGLVNWQGGGQPALTVTGIFSGFANYASGKDKWNNLLEMGYGITRLGKDGEAQLRKSEDRLIFTSKYSRELSETMGFAALLDFRSQFDKGFKYNVKYKAASGADSLVNERISDFLSPAYTLSSIGIDYRKDTRLYVLFSPLTAKTTIVMDKELSAAGAFGVEKGKNLRYQVGMFLNTVSKLQLMENVSWQSSLYLFGDYKTPDRIDIFWDNSVLLTVNKFLQASFNTNLIYDDDIRIPREDGSPGGPGIQFKHVLALGLVLKLK
jgi:hypothetical protein